MILGFGQANLTEADTGRNLVYAGVTYSSEELRNEKINRDLDVAFNMKQSGQLDEAKDIFLKVLDQNFIKAPKLEEHQHIKAASNRNLGDIFFRQGLFKEAKYHHLQVLKVNEKEAESWQALGLIEYKVFNRLQEARRCLEASISSRKYFIRKSAVTLPALMCLIEINFKLKDFERCELLLEMVLNRNRFSAPNFYQICCLKLKAFFHSIKGEYDQKQETIAHLQQLTGSPTFTDLPAIVNLTQTVEFNLLKRGHRFPMLDDDGLSYKYFELENGSQAFADAKKYHDSRFTLVMIQSRKIDPSSVQHLFWSTMRIVADKLIQGSDRNSLDAVLHTKLYFSPMAETFKRFFEAATNAGGNFTEMTISREKLCRLEAKALEAQSSSGSGRVSSNSSISRTSSQGNATDGTVSEHMSQASVASIDSLQPNEDEFKADAAEPSLKRPKHLLLDLEAFFDNLALGSINLLSLRALAKHLTSGFKAEELGFGQQQREIMPLTKIHQYIRSEGEVFKLVQLLKAAPPEETEAVDGNGTLGSRLASLKQKPALSLVDSTLAFGLSQIEDFSKMITFLEGKTAPFAIRTMLQFAFERQRLFLNSVNALPLYRLFVFLLETQGILTKVIQENDPLEALKMTPYWEFRLGGPKDILAKTGLSSLGLLYVLEIMTFNQLAQREDKKRADDANRLALIDFIFHNTSKFERDFEDGGLPGFLQMNSKSGLKLRLYFALSVCAYDLTNRLEQSVEMFSAFEKLCTEAGASFSFHLPHAQAFFFLDAERIEKFREEKISKARVFKDFDLGLTKLTAMRSQAPAEASPQTGLENDFDPYAQFYLDQFFIHLNKILVYLGSSSETSVNEATRPSSSFNAPVSIQMAMDQAPARLVSLLVQEEDTLKSLWKKIMLSLKNSSLRMRLQLSQQLLSMLSATKICNPLFYADFFLQPHESDSQERPGAGTSKTPGSAFTLELLHVIFDQVHEIWESIESSLPGLYLDVNCAQLKSKAILILSLIFRSKKQTSFTKPRALAIEITKLQVSILRTVEAEFFHRSLFKKKSSDRVLQAFFQLIELEENLGAEESKGSTASSNLSLQSALDRDVLERAKNTPSSEFFASLTQALVVLSILKSSLLANPAKSMSTNFKPALETLKILEGLVLDNTDKKEIVLSGFLQGVFRTLPIFLLLSNIDSNRFMYQDRDPKVLKRFGGSKPLLIDSPKIKLEEGDDLRDLVSSILNCFLIRSLWKPLPLPPPAAAAQPRDDYLMDSSPKQQAPPTQEGGDAIMAFLEEQILQTDPPPQQQAEEEEDQEDIRIQEALKLGFLTFFRPSSDQQPDSTRGLTSHQSNQQPNQGNLSNSSISGITSNSSEPLASSSAYSTTSMSSSGPSPSQVNKALESNSFFSFFQKNFKLGILSLAQILRFFSSARGNCLLRFGQLRVQDFQELTAFFRYTLKFIVEAHTKVEQSLGPLTTKICNLVRIKNLIKHKRDDDPHTDDKLALENQLAREIARELDREAERQRGRPLPFQPTRQRERKPIISSNTKEELLYFKQLSEIYEAQPLGENSTRVDSDLALIYSLAMNLLTSTLLSDSIYHLPQFTIAADLSSFYKTVEESSGDSEGPPIEIIQKPEYLPMAYDALRAAREKKQLPALFYREEIEGIVDEIYIDESYIHKFQVIPDDADSSSKFVHYRRDTLTRLKRLKKILKVAYGYQISANTKGHLQRLYSNKLGKEVLAHIQTIEFLQITATYCMQMGILQHSRYDSLMGDNLFLKVQSQSYTSLDKRMKKKAVVYSVTYFTKSLKYLVERQSMILQHNLYDAKETCLWGAMPFSLQVREVLAQFARAVQARVKIMKLKMHKGGRSCIKRRIRKLGSKLDCLQQVLYLLGLVIESIELYQPVQDFRVQSSSVTREQCERQVLAIIEMVLRFSDYSFHQNPTFTCKYFMNQANLSKCISSLVSYKLLVRTSEEVQPFQTYLPLYLQVKYIGSNTLEGMQTFKQMGLLKQALVLAQKEGNQCGALEVIRLIIRRMTTYSSKFLQMGISQLSTSNEYREVHSVIMDIDSSEQLSHFLYRNEATFHSQAEEAAHKALYEQLIKSSAYIPTSKLIYIGLRALSDGSKLQLRLKFWRAAIRNCSSYQWLEEFTEKSKTVRTNTAYYRLPFNSDYHQGEKEKLVALYKPIIDMLEGFNSATGWNGLPFELMTDKNEPTTLLNCNDITGFSLERRKAYRFYYALLKNAGMSQALLEIYEDLKEKFTERVQRESSQASNDLPSSQTESFSSIGSELDDRPEYDTLITQELYWRFAEAGCRHIESLLKLPEELGAAYLKIRNVLILYNQRLNDEEDGEDSMEEDDEMKVDESGEEEIRISSSADKEGGEQTDLKPGDLTLSDMSEQDYDDYDDEAELLYSENPAPSRHSRSSHEEAVSSRRTIREQVEHLNSQEQPQQQHPSFDDFEQFLSRMISPSSQDDADDFMEPEATLAIHDWPDELMKYGSSQESHQNSQSWGSQNSRESRSGAEEALADGTVEASDPMSEERSQNRSSGTVHDESREYSQEELPDPPLKSKYARLVQGILFRGFAKEAIAQNENSQEDSKTETITEEEGSGTVQASQERTGQMTSRSASAEVVSVEDSSGSDTEEEGSGKNESSHGQEPSSETSRKASPQAGSYPEASAEISQDRSLAEGTGEPRSRSSLASGASEDPRASGEERSGNESSKEDFTGRKPMSIDWVQRELRKIRKGRSSLPRVIQEEFKQLMESSRNQHEARLREKEIEARRAWEENEPLRQAQAQIFGTSPESYKAAAAEPSHSQEERLAERDAAVRRDALKLLKVMDNKDLSEAIGQEGDPEATAGKYRYRKTKLRRFRATGQQAATSGMAASLSKTQKDIQAQKQLPRFEGRKRAVNQRVTISQESEEEESDSDTNSEDEKRISDHLQELMKKNVSPVKQGKSQQSAASPAKVNLNSDFDVEAAREDLKKLKACFVVTRNKIPPSLTQVFEAYAATHSSEDKQLASICRPFSPRIKKAVVTISTLCGMKDDLETSISELLDQTKLLDNYLVKCIQWYIALMKQRKKKSEQSAATIRRLKDILRGLEDD